MNIFKKLKNTKKQKDIITDAQAQGLIDIMKETVEKLREYCNEEGLAFTPALWSIGSAMKGAAEELIKEDKA